MQLLEKTAVRVKWNSEAAGSKTKTRTWKMLQCRNCTVERLFFVGTSLQVTPFPIYVCVWEREVGLRLRFMSDNKVPEAKLFRCTWDTNPFLVLFLQLHLFFFLPGMYQGELGAARTYSKYQTIKCITLNVVQECRRSYLCILIAVLALVEKVLNLSEKFILTGQNWHLAVVK